MIASSPSAALAAVVSVVAVGVRGAGERYGRPASVLSPRAQAIGLVTPADAWAEYRAQTDPETYARDQAWSRGRRWVCCFCATEFESRDGAGSHMRRLTHPVLRWLDLYEEMALWLR